MVDREYFTRAYLCVFEIGAKLAHVIWRKLAPTDAERADNEFLSLQYEALLSREYALAEILGTFYRKWVKKKSSDELRRMILVNEAIALDRQNKTESCHQLLHEDDWSSTSVKFKLAVAVLESRMDDVVNLMGIIGANGEIDKNAYCNWPLFARVRKNKSFLSKFEEVFEERLEVAEAFKKIEPKKNEDATGLSVDGLANLVDEFEAPTQDGVQPDEPS